MDNMIREFAQTLSFFFSKVELYIYTKTFCVVIAKVVRDAMDTVWEYIICWISSSFHSHYVRRIESLLECSCILSRSV